jgi:hypothetical protein
VDELHALGQGFVVVDDRGLGDALGGVLGQGLDDQRELQLGRPPHALALLEDREAWAADAVEAQDLLGERLVVGQQQAARVDAGVGHVAQLQEAHHMGVVEADALEVQQQVEGDVGFELLDRLAHAGQGVRHAQDVHLVTHGLQGASHVVLGLEGLDLLLGEALDGLRRDGVLVHQEQDAQLPHRR